jgi:zinc transporter ZupT
MQGFMSILNAFSGAVFLSVGITHLLPHVLEYQELAYPSMKYPLGLVTIVLGFLLILFVEQVVFDVHGASHDDQVRRPSPEGGVAKYTAAQNTISISKKYQDPLLTEAALIIHATLESIVLGLAVSLCSIRVGG